MKFYQLAVTTNGSLQYGLTIDPKLDYLVWSHFVKLVERESYNELQLFTKNFNDKRLISSGSHGTVHRGKAPKKLAKFLGLDSRYVAVKTMKGGGGNIYFESYLAEAKWLPRLRHPNIVQLVGHCIHCMTEWFLVYKYVDGWTLDHLIRQRSPDFTGQRMLRVIKGITEGMNYLHSIEDGLNQGLVHGDLKPTNIMVNKDFDAIIIDFGSARVSTEEASLGTKYFVKDEDNEKGLNAHPLHDAYAFGMTILRTIAWGYPLYVGDELHKLAASAVGAKPQRRKGKRTGVVPALHHAMHPSLLEGDDGCSEATARTLTEIGVNCTKDWDSRASIASVRTRIVDLV
ncbi:putative receptor-like protein kinase At1g72540 [Tripterygium wilfordii]|uniref:putative receptor-like protein kinase At1g72540 n=1 Tax=Tripterygium wilfordii TaxID=458696 RepID=UPI0018F8471A|nr:putative receptor-like protein kinase At1g72540 [Tripterygium wilfordii]